MNKNNHHRLWYKQPAKEWEEALPIGNGRIGAMMFGKLQQEQLQLNEDTLWSGFPRDCNNYEALRHLKGVRELLAESKFSEAEHLIQEKMLAVNCQAYQPLGDLYISWLNAPETYEHYERGVNLETAAAYVDITANGKSYSREAWISAVDQVYVIRYTSEQADLNLQAYFEIPHPSSIRITDRYYCIEGRCPTHIADNYFGDHPYAVQYEDNRGIIFQSQLRAISDGIVNCTQQGIVVEQASYVYFMGSIKTSFISYQEQPHQSFELLTTDNNKILDKLVSLPYDRMIQAHINDHSELFHRVQFSLNKASIPSEGDTLALLATDERLERYKQGHNDLGLESLYFHYGKYLLITCSRPGTQPANLQGIWNHRVQPPWNSDYTTNINTQMNYWPAELLSLSECHEPLLTMIEELAEAGKRTAKIHYHADGWVTHHNVDLWRMTSPTAGHPSWAFWPMGGVWLTQHLWERYLFHPNLDYLREKVYPVIKGAAQFCLDWLVEDDKGRLITSPSTSPENQFKYGDSQVSSVAQASAMDMTLVKELFEHVIEASELLQDDVDFAKQIQQALSRLAPLKINNQGLLQEWDQDFAEDEPGHRHVSHLYGLFPGTTIQKQELLEAAKASLASRIANGGGHTGWSCAWLINLYARLHMKHETYQFIRTLIARSTYNNLFDAHPPFQIDGNFGGVAGMIEAVAQSHQGKIELLPALPEEWTNGDVSGLTMRGGFKLSLAWRAGKLLKATILSLYGHPLEISYELSISILDEYGNKIASNHQLFATTINSSYTIHIE